jgi:hypothetical protein
MPMPDEWRMEIGRMLQERGAQGKYLQCGNEEVVIMEYIGLIPLVDYPDHGLDQQTHTPMPVVIATCTRCNFVSMHKASAIPSTGETQA